MDALLTTLRGLGPVRLGLMGALFIAVLGFLIYSISSLTAPNMALLYGELDIAEGAQIVSKLESMGVPVEIKAGGSQVYVPEDQVLRLRMNMAETGIPSGASIGYEIFDRSDVLGSTSFVQDVNLLRALEGELARTIRALQPVATARVHIVLPKRELFSREQQKPTASVVLKMKGGAKLSQAQAQAVQQLLASSVPGLMADQVAIIDDRGTLIARGEGKDPSSVALGYEETRKSHEMNIARIVESLLEKSLGVGKVRAEVSVEMDLDRMTEQSEVFNPDGQVIRSTQNSSEKDRNQSGGADATTFQNTLPNAASGGGAGKQGNQSDSQKSEETVNYEISKTMKTYVKELGGVKRVSVAVLIDGDYRKDEKGVEKYTPKTPAELSQIEKLVKAAVGFKADRGDAVEIVNMRFSSESQSDLAALGTSFLGLDQKDIVYLIELLILGAVIALVGVFVVRPLVARMMDMSKPALVEGQQEGILGNLDDPGSNSAGVPDGQGTELQPADMDNPFDDEVVDVGNVQIIGKMRMANLKKIEMLIEEHPEDAVSVIRTWMRQS
ncbi:MAG: flagellar basal-body MS-ring/collar protein FliF [Alphaproteobacteria bacterium]